MERDGRKDGWFSALVHTCGVLLATGADHRRTDPADMADSASVQDSVCGRRLDAVSRVRDTELPIQAYGEVLTGGSSSIMQ